jgi:hypothetical protein
MTDWALDLSPLLPLPLLGAAALAAALLLAVGLLQRRRGTVLRLLAIAMSLAVLLGPSLRMEERERLPTVVALVSDESASQTIGARQAETAAAIETLSARLAELPDVEVRTVRLATDPEAGTRFTEPLRTALADVPGERIGAVITVSDGRLADADDVATSVGEAPVHAFLTGRTNEGDRRIELLQVPRFALVDSIEPVRFRIVEDGRALDPSEQPTVALTLLRNNEVLAQANVPVGVDVDVPLSVDRAGDSLFEIRIEPAPGELTALNNQAVFTIEGVRDTLRVLLVSGEPHAGERTWRNLLKSDPSVDLVHFTILRPPEKQDGTPISELSLIAFPTRELFVERINDFDLIILDRYQRRSVLPLVYFDNIADYVRRGGALLVAAGPEFSDQTSIAFTALADILPAYPTGRVAEEPFRARVSALGRRHPITRALPGDVDPEADRDPDWSRWFRIIEAEPMRGAVVAMEAPAEGPMPGAPLLTLSEAGDGRVALLLSDHVWLWARNFEGGGPHVPLLRRTAHWLMREPDLEVETLDAAVRGEQLIIERRTLGDSVPDLSVTRPDGSVERVAPQAEGDGLFVARLPGADVGLYRITDGELTTLAHGGAPNAQELQQVVSTDAALAPLVETTRGTISRLVEDDGTELSIPRVRLVGASARASGNGWIGVRRTEATVLTGARQVPLTLGLWTLLPALALWGAAWWREGR